MTEELVEVSEHRGAGALTTRTQFAAALTAVRERAGLTVRDLSRRLDVPPATLGGYFSGRHLPTVSQVPKLIELLATCGVTDRTEVDAWLDALSRMRGNGPRRGSKPPAPYRGLEAFGPEDAELFFGRDAEIVDILDRLRLLAADPGPSAGVLVVLGPSGSGKSSLLRAGVVAAVRDGALDTGEQRWTCELATPGPDPATALRPVLGVPDPGERRVVVVDQFEELFTSVPDPAVRAAVLRSLAERPDGVLLVIGLRADFYATAATEPFLLAALQHAHVLVGPLGVEQVRQAILQPAELAGMSVDDGLVDLLLADLAPRDAVGFAHDAGALPLLSHALLSTWDRATGTRLTIADYREAGGIDTAVQRTAEDLFTSLSPDEQDLARRMFLRLVNIDDEVAVTRRRVGRDELSRLTDATASANADTLVDAFVERRLLTVHANAVEISHEALLSAWPRLRRWVDADRAGLRVHRRVTEAATMWTDADEDPSLLLRGVRLESATEWAADDGHVSELDPLERRYLDASTERASFERTRERRRSRRLRRLLAVAAVLAVVAAVLAVFALKSRSTAVADRESAEQARRDALARQVSAESNQLLATDPALGQQLALVAYRLSPNQTATAALIDASSSPQISRLAGHAGPTPLALSHDGRLAAVGDASNGDTRLYRTRTGRPDQLLSTLPGSHDPVHHQLYALAFTPDDHTLVTGGDTPAMTLWDVRDPAHPARLSTIAPGFAGGVQCIAVSPDGTTMAAVSIGKVSLQLWNIANPAAPVRLPAPLGQPRFTSATAEDAITLKTVAFSPDGSMLAAAGTGEWLREWTTRTAATTPPRVARIPPAAVATNAVVYDRTGRYLVTVSGDGTIVYRRSTDLTEQRSLPVADNAAPAYSVAFSPDGTQLAVGSADGKLTQWSTTTDSPIAVTAHPGPVTGVAYSPDSRRIMTTATDGALWSWQSTGPTVQVAGSVFNVSFSADGRRMATFANRAGGTQIWDTSEPTAPKRIGPLLSMPTSAGQGSGSGAVRPDGRQLAVGTATGDLVLWALGPDGTAISPPDVFHVSKKLIEYAVYSPDGKVLAVVGDDNMAHFLDVSDPAKPRVLAQVASQNFVFTLAYNSTGTLAATASADGHVRIYDVRDPAHPVLLSTLGGFSSYVYGVAFSAHGPLLAATGADFSTHVWDVADPRHPVSLGAPLTGPTDYNLTLSFSDDGRLLAVASNDGNAWVYATHGLHRPTLLGALRRITGANVLSTVFVPHRDVLYGAGRLEQMAVWTVDPTGYAREACAGVGTPISPQEWAQYVPGAAYDPPCR